jgi:peptidoglycan/LPS O-acetylase OafA/YrhL
MIKARISILDGFRSLAILSVILFHFFSRWTPPINKISLYPYTNAYDYFGYGGLGVQFFFIISGFVIYFTLDTTANFSSFWKKRLIRLLPSIIIASLITFTIFRLFDHSYLFPLSHKIENFIPSITFISPKLLNNLFGHYNLNFDYITGAYWSLWPEIQFYLLASVIYYFNKEKFIEYFIVISIFIIGINYSITEIQESNKLHINLPDYFLFEYSKWVQNGFNLVKYLPFFCLGVLFYLLFKNKQLNHKTSNFIKLSFILLQLFIVYSGYQLHVKLIYCLMSALFFIFIYSPKTLKIFEHKILTNVGQSSYFLYLIHENIGVLIIYSVGQYFLPLGFILPLILIFALAVLSNLFTSKVDKKINSWLKRKVIPATPTKSDYQLLSANSNNIETKLSVVSTEIKTKEKIPAEYKSNNVQHIKE